MSEIKLLKMKIVKKETLTVAYVVDRRGKKSQVHTIEDAEPVHQDLRNAFIGLHIHFALLSDYVQVKQVKDIENYDSDLIKDFYVSGVTLGGAEDESYIILTGQKTTASGKVVIINTPHTRIEEDDKTRYRYMDELMERVHQVEKEVREYMAGKYAPDVQGSLDFEAGTKKSVTHAKVLTPEGIVGDLVNGVNAGIEGQTPKRGRPRKVAQSAQHPSGEVAE